jgi:peptidyl-prolyl cis-trans isomerase B (cyclophilin B)
VWIGFIIENTGNEPITLTVPGTEPDIPSPETGLPISHIFSGSGTSGVTVTTEAERQWEQPVGYRKPTRAPILMVGPRSSVGTTIDLRTYFPAFRGAGRYRVTWRPYGAGVSAEPIVLSIAPLKQAEIVTDDGTMTVRFLYENAPMHVDNFLELAQSGSYNGKVFHRIEPGYLLQGGCPRGDGTGIRPDGKRIRAEFNGHPMQKGTVAMALLDDDPDSASCQFFICNTRQKDWDGRYTAFGELVGEESFSTLDRLMATPVDADGRPQQTLYIRSVRIVGAPADGYLSPG